MSTGARIGAWVLRVVVPLAVFAVVIAVFFGERMSIDHELQLIAPDEVAPGDPLPLRGLLFGNLEAMSGPELLGAPVEVTLEDADGTVHARTELRPATAGGSEGGLDVPASILGTYALHAVALIGDAPVASTRRRLEVRASPARAPRIGRPATELQQLAIQPIEALADQVPPSRFDVRVIGGACVPEQPCALLVHVGNPAASIALAGSEEDTALSAEIVRLEVTVHGPESRVVLEARRDGLAVARRTVQLPVALATPSLQIDSHQSRPSELEVHVLGDRPGIIVDAFAGGRWMHTASVPPSDDPFPLPFALGDGVWCIQARADPYSGERAAVRYVVIGDVDDPNGRITALGGVGAAPSGDDELRFAWAATSLEAEVFVQPPGASGFAADQERVASRQNTLRTAALIAMAFGIIIAVLVFLRRGIDSALVAQRVMDATGDPELMSARHARRTLLGALALVFTVALAFIGAFALITLRAHLL